MNVTFLSTIGSSNSCTFSLCRFELRSGLLTQFFPKCHDIEVEANCVLISVIFE